MTSATAFRTMAGVFARDLPRYAGRLLLPGSSYLSICNRNERLERGPDGKGYRCMWQWTSDLHAARHLPALATTLMRRALGEHPVRRMAAPAGNADQPQLSFVIGHRGLGRLPHLLATLESIAGQSEAVVECIVVEQDQQALLAGRLPDWVRHVHTPLPEPGLAYCRSWAFNVGVRYAHSHVLVFHDNDMLVPSDYAAQILALVGRGYEVLNLKRFVFYLTQEHTRGVFRGNAGLADTAPLAIVQNLEAGGSVAITRTAYDAIGGFDEAFVGWGGEDVEFWERACSRRVWPYAFLPVVHLWHDEQPGKGKLNKETLALYYSMAHTPVPERIANLLAAPSGSLSGPRR